jgi:predicted nuclease of predicted toxin-antitoxin system
LRILLDHAVPGPLRDFLPGHEVRTAHELGWSALHNAGLLERAEKQFDVLVTTDRDLLHQQNRSASRIALLVLPTSSWPRARNHTERIAMAMVSFGTAGHIELRF